MSHMPSGRFSMSGSPLMVIPCATAASRAAVTMRPWLLAPVTGDVDHLPHGSDAALAKLPETEVDGTRDGGVAEALDRALGQSGREGLAVRRVLDHGPGHHHLLV